MGIDLKAGGKSKKTKRTAPKSDDVYLKLLVKVYLDSLCFLYVIFNLFDGFNFVVWCALTALPILGKEDRKQVQCGDT